MRTSSALFAAFSLFGPLLALSACKPPPSDTTTTGHMARNAPDAPPPPLPSPDSEGAMWAESKTQGRIIYGQPGKAPLIALRCLSDGSEAWIELTRLSPADEEGKAFFAIVGNGTVLRVAVDATEMEGGFVWQGLVNVGERTLKVFNGSSEATATLPGAGMVTLNPSSEPADVIEQCRASIDPAEFEKTPVPVESTSEDIAPEASEPSPPDL